MRGSRFGGGRSNLLRFSLVRFAEAAENAEKEKSYNLKSATEVGVLTLPG